MKAIVKLPKVSTVALINSEISMLHMANLLPLGANLQFLDISHNLKVDDNLLPLTAFFPFLRHINLDATSITMDGLRTYASVSLPLRRLPYTQLIVPVECRRYLQEAVDSRYYAFHINEPYLIIKVCWQTLSFLACCIDNDTLTDCGGCCEPQRCKRL